jgi:hypothetical protein
MNMRPRIGWRESESDDGSKKIVAKIRSLPLRLVKKKFDAAAAEHKGDGDSDIITGYNESLDHSCADGDVGVLSEVKVLPQSSLPLVDKLTDAGDIEMRPGGDAGESIKSTGPSTEYIGTDSVTFATEPTEMSREQQQDVQIKLYVHPHLTNAPDQTNESTLNLETPASIMSDQNIGFAFFSQSKSSDHGSVNNWNQAAAVSTTDEKNKCVNDHVHQNLPTVQEQGIPKGKLKSLSQNCALETTNDRIDEDALSNLSNWWFLGSKSTESVEDESVQRKTHLTANVNKQEIQSDIVTQQLRLDESTSDSSKRLGSRAASWILRSFSSSEKTHSLRVKSTQSSGSSNLVVEMAEKKPSTFAPQINPSLSRSYGKQSKPQISALKTRQPIYQPQRGGDFTIKEQHCRREWLMAMGGTVNYDQPAEGDSGDASSVASYQFVPHQTDTLQIINSACSMYNDPNKSPDWDPSMRPKRRHFFNDWTPQDSSYGAALPAFGCIPKRIRKLIEIAFVLVITAMLIYFVIKLGILLIGSDHSASTKDLDFLNDDDHYIANSNNNGNQDSADGRSNDGPDRLLSGQNS